MKTGKRQTAKPRLFIDVDGVILARYGENRRFQMRPHVGDFLAFAAKHFRCFWITCHDADDCEYIERFACVRGAVTFADFPMSRGLDKVQAVVDHGGLRGEWFAIEDERPVADGWTHLKAKNLSHRWLICPRDGRDVLLRAKEMLEAYLETGVMRAPKGWEGGDNAR